MKNNIILVNRHGRKSMKEVLKAIPDTNLLIKSSIFNGYISRQNGIKTKLRNLEKPDCTNSIILRWGSTAEIETDKTSIVYNSNEVVNKSNDKPLCRRILQDAGIAVPKTYFPDSNFENAKYPLVSRRRKHGQGRGIVMAQNFDHVQRLIMEGFAYFSEFYPKKKEIRVHCFAGKILAVMSKTGVPDKIAWNVHQTGIGFEVLDRKDWPEGACRLALQACQLIGNYWSGVDVMLDAGPNYPEAVIVELNSAPTICNSPYVLNKYINGFKWLFSSQTRQPKWDYTKFKKVESLAMKEEQMLPGFKIPEDKCFQP